MSFRVFGALLLAGLPVIGQAPLSLEKEAGLGQQLAAEFRRQHTQIENSIVQEYLNRLGQKLAAQMPEARLPFTFSAVVDDACRITHEPAAFPGGYIFVTSSLFLAAQGEAEFAGMLAHAMAHITQRHGIREANNPNTALIFMGGAGGTCSEGQAIPLGFAASLKSNELEADALAIRTMARAGLDPRALIRYIERVQVRPADRDQRLAAMSSTIDKLPKLPPVDYAAGPPNEFAAAQQEVRHLVEQPVRDKAPPSLMRKRPE